MLVISTCPKCQAQVSIPAGVDSSASVRCPLCEVEYPLSEALPPALIPVAAVAIQDSALEEDVAEVEGGAVGEFFFTREEPRDQADAENEANEAAAVVVDRASITAAPLRKRASKSALQTIIEVVTGGLAGCLVAYYALAFYFGPDFKNVGLPKLPLPFISALTAAPDEADSEEQEQAAEKPSGSRAAGDQTMSEVSESPENPSQTPAEKSGDGPPGEEPPPVEPPTATE